MGLITEALATVDGAKSGGKSGKAGAKKEENKDDVAETCLL